MPEYRNYDTPYGTIRYRPETCKDDYANFVTYDQGGGNTILTLQEPAMQAFMAAQVRFAKRSGWSKKRIENNPEGRPIKVLPGTNRTCDTQRRLRLQDPGRYADPDVTGHTRGIAIDIDQNQDDVAVATSCLLAEGWTRVRADEPWHASYGVTV